VPHDVEKLKHQPGKPIFVPGSSDLVQTVMEHDLIDEYPLWLHPAVLGGGKTLLHDGLGAIGPGAATAGAA
jgi:dihydrofolate reductase